MHFVLSNNIQTILAVGLGTCQGELKKRNPISIFQNGGSSDGGTRHSVASKTTLESTKDNQSNVVPPIPKKKPTLLNSS